MGPGMSLVLQTSQGFLQCGVGGPWEVLYGPLIKTICVNAAMALLAHFFGAGEGSTGGHRVGQDPRLIAKQPGKKKEGLVFVSRREGRSGHAGRHPGPLSSSLGSSLAAPMGCGDQRWGLLLGPSASPEEG